MSGGQDVFTFYASGNFLTEDGPMPANWAEKVGGRANFQWTPSNVFDLAISSGYVNNEIRLPNNDNNIFGFWGNLTLATPAGIRQTSAGNFAFGEPFTSAEDVREIDSRFTNDRFTGSATANFNPLPWLKARGIFGIDVNAEENFQFIPFGAVANLNPEGEKTVVRNTTVNITLDQNTTAIWDLTEALQSSTSFGTQVTNENVDEVVAFGDGGHRGNLARPGGGGTAGRWDGGRCQPERSEGAHAGLWRLRSAQADPRGKRCPPSAG